MNEQTSPTDAPRTTTSDNIAAGFIDAHSHIWTRNVQKYPLTNGQTPDDLKPASFTAAELLAAAKPLGVSRVVLIQHRPYHGVDNSYIIDSMRDNPGRFSAVACIEANQSRPQDDMDRLASLGVRGFRIRPADGGPEGWATSAGIRAMWKHAAETGLLICPLINPVDLPVLTEFCRDFPQANVVIDHFARVGIDGEIHHADLKMLLGLARFPKTHVKLSAFYALGRKQPPYTDLLPMLQLVLEAYGRDRLMWASDAPYQLAEPNNLKASVELMTKHATFLTEADREALMRTTAERLFFSGKSGTES
ncbi:MAG: amidohydrolase family protein [Planctomycetaceae bacterium]